MYQFNWKEIFLTPIEITSNTKLREFQFKILNRILYTNNMLYKFKKVQSPLCYFCLADKETLRHFLFCCPQVEVFWKEIVLLFKDNLKITKCFEITDNYFAIKVQDNYASLLNYIMLEGRYYLYLCKLNIKPLPPRLLLGRIKNISKIKLFIAREKKKTNSTIIMRNGTL